MRKFSFFLLLMSFGSSIIFGQNSVNKQNNIRIGVSQVIITPENPILMAGYAPRKLPFTGVHDDIYASAFLFSNEKTKSLLITSDLLGFNFEFIDELKKMISSRIEIPYENILISAVHNHGGPSLSTFRENPSKTTNAYVKSLKEKLTNLSIDASNNLVPFRMGIGKGTCKMNINRRFEFIDGTIGVGRNPDGPCDHELGVVKFEDMNNRILAVLINWSAHGTCAGQDNLQITGDWPGAAARYIRKQISKDVVVGVTAGASADIAPLYGATVKFNEIESVGYHVGIDAFETFLNITSFPVYTTQVSSTKMIFTGKKPIGNNLPQTSYEVGPDSEIRLSILKIGNLILAGVSGELMTEMGLQIKNQSPYSNTLIVTHCNGSSGYICTDKSFPEGGYEVNSSRFMPGVEKPLVQKILELIHSF